MHCVDAGLGHPIEDELHVCAECRAFSELCLAFADMIPFQDGMHANICCRHQKALAPFLYPRGCSPVARIAPMHVLSECNNNKNGVYMYIHIYIYPFLELGSSYAHAVSHWSMD